MQFFDAIHHLEIGPEFSVQRFCVVARHFEAATVRRSVWTKSPHKNVTAWSNCASHLTNVRDTLVDGGKKVEDGTVMPKIVGICKLAVEYIRDNLVDSVRGRP